ncbi:MAG TPA: hypothetical protein ENJ82_02565 [Bacteroidetes bacterium]|nr:hypothetical protein [Bacteroidota bacterium]
MAAKERKGSGVLRIIFFPLRLALLVILPFILLIRVSVLAYAQFELSTWLSLGVGGLLTFLLLYFYMNRISRAILGKKKSTDGTRTFSLRAAMFIVGGFCLYALLYLSASNAKTETVKSEFTSVHPLLRLSVSALALLDQDLIITDMSRTHADYDDMGLKRLNNSLHYPQKDGYVHAIDLRTNGRSEWRNSLLKWYFWAMGMNTLRHVGTGDHLHISLIIWDNPKAI